MHNFREVNYDILKDWLDFSEDDLCSLTCDEDKKHFVYFDEISEKIWNTVPVQNKKYAQKRLDFLDLDFMNYIFYRSVKYYKNVFVDGYCSSDICFGCGGKTRTYDLRVMRTRFSNSLFLLV